QSLYFGKPYLYSLLAAPFAGLWGAKGMVAFNMLMLIGMIWMAALWLRRHNPAWLADSFAAFFFIASVGWSYVYWLHPEVLNMFAAASCLFFGLSVAEKRPGGPAGDAAEKARPARRGERFWASPWPLVLSASGLALGVYNKPMLAALGLPVVFELLRRRRWKGLAIWLAASVASISIYALGSVVLTGQPTAYLVDLRAGFPVHNPYLRMVEPAPEPPPAAPGEEAVEEDSRSAAWWWIFSVPNIQGFELREDLVGFTFGKHTGFVPYQPFAALSILLFLIHGRRRFAGWWVLASAFSVGLFFLIFIPFNWHGGGGFVGNRYFVMAYPAFVFLVTRISPSWSLLPFAAAAGFFVGPLVLAPHGLAVPQPTLQSHVRSAAFSLTPIEYGIWEIPGYHGQVQKNVWLWGRKDHIRPVEEELWLLAGDRAELWIQTVEPMTRLELELRSGAEGENPARLRIGDQSREVVLGAEPVRVVFEPTEAQVERRERRREDYDSFFDLTLYRLEFEIERGRMPWWSDEPGPLFFRGASMRVVDVQRRTPAEDVAQ
ncbi:MAG: hypothetical protein AAF725_25675, partial [Acidobacteriota bacterium]